MKVKRTNIMHSHGEGLSRRDYLKIMAAALASTQQFPSLAMAASRTADVRKRVIVLGIDGMSPDLLSDYVARGRMPHFARLIQDGGFRRLGSSNPPQSPVAWSNFITGTNPGGHGIFDFIHRDPATMTPYLSTSRVLPPSSVLALGAWRFPLRAGSVELLRRGPAFWKILADAGIPCTVYRLPANFPPVECGARSLSGLGTPDLVGAYGVCSYVTDVEPPDREKLTSVKLTVVDMSSHHCEASLVGPENTLRSDHPSIEVPFSVDRDEVNPVAKITVQDTEIVLKQGEWSDWVRVAFPLLPHLKDVAGTCRFFLKEVHPKFKLYVSPINIDPSEPALPISTPADFSRSLAHDLGLFSTQGIAEDTKALSAGVLDERDYLQQAMQVLDENVRAYELLLKQFTRGLLFFYFSSIDLNSHMYWRAMDPRHPLYSPELGRQFGKTIEDLYVRMDAILGMAMEHADKDTTLLVLSDHGFHPFYRTFSQNTWLLEHGYAQVTDPGLRTEGQSFSATDWNRTQAYGLGINGLYLNLEGREMNGIVRRGREEERLLNQLVAKLEATKDPDTGHAVFHRVYKAKDIYRGPYLDAAPDLILGFNEGYRASWKTILGAYEDKVVADNDDKWSGDHCMDVESLSGVLLANRPITSETPSLVDLAPTILAEFGMPPPPETEGKAILAPNAS